MRLCLRKNVEEVQTRESRFLHFPSTLGPVLWIAEGQSTWRVLDSKHVTIGVRQGGSTGMEGEGETRACRTGGPCIEGEGGGWEQGRAVGSTNNITRTSSVGS